MDEAAAGLVTEIQHAESDGPESFSVFRAHLDFELIDAAAHRTRTRERLPLDSGFGFAALE
jgi:hypothetical protein